MAIFDVHAYLGRDPYFGGMADKQSIRATFGQHGITTAALISGLSASCDFVAGNQELKDVVDPAAGLFGYVTLNADYPEESIEEQRRYLGKRAFIGAVIFGRPNHPVTLEDAREVLNAHRRYAKPMAIFANDADAIHSAREIAVEFPSMKFILLTMGGDDWHSAIAAARQYLNLYLEISGSLDSDKIAHAAAVLTPRKLLYGSGLPHGDPELTLGLVADTPSITNFDRSRILAENAQTLFLSQIASE